VTVAEKFCLYVRVTWRKQEPRLLLRYLRDAQLSVEMLADVWAFTTATSSATNKTTNVVDDAAYRSTSSFRSIWSIMADEHKC